MNVQELIKHLKQFDPKTEVLFSVTDHTDYTTKFEVNEDNVYLGIKSCDDDTEEELWDDEGEYIGPEVVLFEANYYC